MEASLVTKTVDLFPPFTCIRRQYHESGALMSTLTTNHPVPGAGYAGGEKYTYRDWSRTPNYKTLRKTQGWLPTLSLTHDYFRIDGQNWSGTYRHRTKPLQRFELDNGYLNMPKTIDYVENQALNVNPIRDALINDAKMSALDRARDMRTNLPVFFGEGHQSVRMLTNTAQTLGRAYHAFRKGKWGEAAKHLGIDKPFQYDRKFANHWLAYQYGWKPLLSDAVGAATFLYDLVENNRFERSTFRSSERRAPPKSYVGDFGADARIPGWRLRISWEREIAARAGLLVRCESSAAASAAQLGVGLTDPLLTAWELTPFSFVFDWFVDVGGWLEAASSLQGFRVLTGYLSCNVSYKGNVTQYDAGSSYPVASKVASWGFTTRRYFRQPWQGWIGSIRSPLIDGLTASRLTTAASLWSQLTKGDRKPGKYKP